jgi:protein disulfide-isomerase A1
MLRDVAGRYKGKLNFETIDAVKHGFFASVLKLIPGRFPAFVIEDLQTGEAYPFDQNEEITADSIAMFVENYFRERLEAQREHKV